MQSSDTAPEDYDLPPLNYPTIYLKIKDEVLRYDQSVNRKKSQCTLLARKVKNLENMISGMQKEMSETIEMKSQLEHQKAVCNRELCSIRFTLNQGKIKLETTKMLLEEHMEQLRREEEQYSKIVDLTQRLECSARSLEVELTTVRKHFQQVEEELKYTQRQLVHEQRARTLQESTLNNLLWKQKEKEAVASKVSQTSEVPESNEKEKDLSDKNQILQDEVVMLKVELHRVKMEFQGKENQFTEDTEVLKETIDELQNKLQLKEEALTKITSQYSGQLNVQTTENEVLNSKLEKAKRSRDRLEAVIALYRSRLTSALHDHE
ncbi:ankyrin repeat domain-containing protein 26-like [Notamacropus eugenii]|uniref:ankyrin repeat domain-containing protein 26-like n=1 Tax=Notamacropus eugenii TaxID=9315 RepID=UPI003B6835BC